MAEVTNYPNPHHLGAPSHRQLAPAPVPKTAFFSHDAFYNMSFQPPTTSSHYEAPQPSMARSPSVSSTCSSASFKAASSRTMSPALSASGSAMMMPASLPRRHSQQLVHRTPYQPHGHAAHPYLSPSQYLPRQPTTQYPLYPSASAPQPFAQTSAFPFRHDYHPPTTFNSYPALSSPAYQVPVALEAPYQQVSIRQQHQHQHQQQVNATLYTHVANLDRKILANIVKHLAESHLGFRDIIHLSMVNRWFHINIATDNFALVGEDAKVRMVLEVERFPERYFLGTGGPEGGPGSSDAASQPSSLGCYHCFKIKGSADFELFRYNTTNTTNTAEETEPERDTAQQNKRSAGPPTANPHYDPSITRSSIKANSRATSSTKMILDMSSPRIKETMGIRRFCIDCGVKKQYYRPGALIELRNEKPAKEKKGKRRDGKDEKDGKEAKWVCDCRLVHKRPEVLQCRACGMMTPFSQNRGGSFAPS